MLGKRVENVFDAVRGGQGIALIAFLATGFASCEKQSPLRHPCLRCAECDEGNTLTAAKCEICLCWRCFMRIIGGVAGGRKLREPVGSEIRPTSDYVKESVFNIVQFDIEGRRVLDLFAGSGQIGIEALSRGAKSAVFVDLSPRSVKLVEENLERCGFSEQAFVRVADALRFLEGEESFDLIYIDPPFDSKLAEACLLKIAKLDKLNINGIILTESKRDAVLPDLMLPYRIVKEYKYGSVKITKHTRGDI